MKEKIILYHNPRCSKSREALSLLGQSQVDYEVVEYLKNPLSENELEKLIKLLGVPPKNLVRTKEELFQKIQVDLESAASIAKALSEFPALMERPLVVFGQRLALIARPPELLLTEMPL